MKIIELVLNEDDAQGGIEAVSVVETPAIEEDFIALKKHEVELKTVNEEKRLLMGPALIPKKQIYRRDEKTEDEYYIYFSKETIRKASQLFLKKANQNNATIEHEAKLKGMTVVESWIVDDKDKDKSAHYGFNAEVGTWFITMKVENDEVWSKVKNGEIKGFSIEGYFTENIQASKQNLKTFVVDREFAIIDDRVAYSTVRKALDVAKDVGCSDYHTHMLNGKIWYMPCKSHKFQQELKRNSDPGKQKSKKEILEELKKLIQEHESKEKKTSKKEK